MSPLLQPGTLDFISHSEEQTIRLGQRLGKLAQSGQVIALIGELGVGKTRWAQGFGLGLEIGTDEIINSPTFTFVNQYQGRYPFYHIDVYRLEDTVDVETLALDDYFHSDGVCLIEWADRIESHLPLERLEVELHHLGPNRRRVIMRAHGSTYQTLLNDFKALTFGTPP